MLKATLKPTSADAALPDGGLTNTRPEIILVRFNCRVLSTFFAVFVIPIVIIIIIIIEKQPHVEKLWKLSWPLTIFRGEGARDRLEIRT